MKRKMLPSRTKTSLHQPQQELSDKNILPREELQKDRRSTVVQSVGKDKNYLMMRIVQYPIIDQQGNYMVCIGDDTPLHQGNDWQLLKGPQTAYIYYMDYRTPPIQQRHSLIHMPSKDNFNMLNGQSKKLKKRHQDYISFSMVAEFPIENVKGTDGKRSEGLGIHTIKIQVNLEIIVASNHFGHVSIYKLQSGEKLCQVGRSGLPKEMLKPVRKLRPYHREKARQLKENEGADGGADSDSLSNFAA